MTSQHPALGIDYGEARIGIAATDPVGIICLLYTSPSPRDRG